MGLCLYCNCNQCSQETESQDGEMADGKGDAASETSSTSGVSSMSAVSEASKVCIIISLSIQAFYCVTRNHGMQKLGKVDLVLQQCVKILMENGKHCRS